MGGRWRLDDRNCVVSRESDTYGGDAPTNGYSHNGVDEHQKEKLGLKVKSGYNKSSLGRAGKGTDVGGQEQCSKRGIVGRIVNPARIMFMEKD